MSALVTLIATFLRDLILAMVQTPKVTGALASPKRAEPLRETSRADIVERARRAGLLALVLLAGAGCGTTHIVVATCYPIEDAPGGWPRVAQDEVLVILDDGTIGTMKAGGYRLVHDSDLKGLLKNAATLPPPR